MAGKVIIEAGKVVDGLGRWVVGWQGRKTASSVDNFRQGQGGKGTVS